MKYPNNWFFIRTRRVISRKNNGIVGLQNTTVKKMTGKPTNPIDWPHQLIWIYTNTNYLLARKTCFVSDPKQAPFYSTTLWLLRKNTHFSGVIACRLEALVINYWWDEGVRQGQLWLKCSIFWTRSTLVSCLLHRKRLPFPVFGHTPLIFCFLLKMKQYSPIISLG